MIGRKRQQVNANLKPYQRRENKINADVSKLVKSLQEEKKILKTNVEFEFKYNNQLQTEMRNLKCENDHLKRENERLIDIENRTRLSYERLWSLIGEQRKIYELASLSPPPVAETVNSPSTSSNETKRRRPNNSWVDIWK